MSDQGEGTDLAALRDEIAELAVRAERFEVERDAARAERDRAVESSARNHADCVKAEREAATLKERLGEAERLLRALDRDVHVIGPGFRWWGDRETFLRGAAPPVEGTATPAEACGKTGPHCVNGPCPYCGDDVAGEWMDGHELKCDACGRWIVPAQLEDGSWMFSKAHADDCHCGDGCPDEDDAPDDPIPCKRANCWRPVAYPGAEYCGAACSEQRQTPVEPTPAPTPPVSGNIHPTVLMNAQQPNPAPEGRLISATPVTPPVRILTAAPPPATEAEPAGEELRITAAIAAARAEAFREALEAVRGERVAGMGDRDTDYNHGVEDCIRAIERLSASPVETGTKETP